MNSNIKKNYYIPAVFLLNIGFLLASIYSLISKDSISSIESWEIFTCLVYLNVTAFCIKHRGAFSVISIMLYMFFIFLLSNIVFDLFGIESMRESSIHLYYKISVQTLETIMMIMVVFLVSVFIVSSTYPNGRNTVINLPHNDGIEKYAQLMIFILAPFALFGNVSDAIQYSMSSTAYAEAYIEDSSSSLYAICEILLRCIVPIYLVSMPRGKYHKLCYFIILVYILSLAFGGSRTQAVLPLCFLVWFYLNTGHSFTKVQYLIGCVTLFAVMTAVVLVRGSAASWNLLLQIASDNATFIMIANVLDYGDMIDTPNNNLYFLSGFINPILRYVVCPDSFVNGRNEEYADASYSLDHKIMFATDPSAFAAGRGFGSSVLIEFYLFGGLIGLLILSLAYTRLTLLLEAGAYKSPLFFILYYWWFQTFIFSPRGTALPNLFNVFVTVGLFVVVYFLAKQLPSRKDDFLSGGQLQKSQRYDFRRSQIKNERAVG